MIQTDYSKIKIQTDYTISPAANTLIDAAYDQLARDLGAEGRIVNLAERCNYYSNNPETISHNAKAQLMFEQRINTRNNNLKVNAS